MKYDRLFWQIQWRARSPLLGEADQVPEATLTTLAVRPADAAPESPGLQASTHTVRRSKAFSAPEHTSPLLKGPNSRLRSS